MFPEFNQHQLIDYLILVCIVIFAILFVKLFEQILNSCVRCCCPTFSELYWLRQKTDSLLGSMDSLTLTINSRLGEVKEKLTVSDVVAQKLKEIKVDK